MHAPALGHVQRPAQGDAKAIDDYNFAAWLYNTGKYGLATESYQNFLKNYPGHAKEPDAHFGLAQSLFHQNQYAEAAQQYEKLRSSAADFPQMPEVLFQLAQSRLALNQCAIGTSASDRPRTFLRRSCRLPVMDFAQLPRYR